MSKGRVTARDKDDFHDCVRMFMTAIVVTFRAR